ncbi:nose resistant to fluoxetine protein 6-like [Pseudomyrmex gracilis]|uniref:nose resistant to fluoxetine protein 6-like n=1 Tax=Pseudomyrmex gracilis TaxID=219809 RepID=UPI000994CF39|nr:nose resistant to fluoxetine protein 6-like [Pseudomyrmex gracilis]
MCMTWSWYLASDMQFYIIGVALLILSTVYMYWTIIILGALLIGSILLSGYISYIYEYIPTLDEFSRQLNIIYFPSWVRIGPYIIGIYTGFLAIRLKNNLILKKKTVILYWGVAITCNILVLFGLYKRYISILSSATYVAFSRTVWAIGVAWILIACLTKNGDCHGFWILND